MSDEQMKITIEQIARVCHEANRAYCVALGDSTQKPWDEADEWQRKSAVYGVQFRLDNPCAPEKALHVAWCADKIADGWKYGPVKDGTKKEHPCLVEFSALPIEQQAKDWLFCAVCDSLLRIIAE